HASHLAPAESGPRQQRPAGPRARRGGPHREGAGGGAGLDTAELAGGGDGVVGEDVAALVLDDAGVAADLDGLGARERPRLAADARDELHVLLRLHGAADDAEGVRRVGVEEDEARSVLGRNRVERPLDGDELGDVVGADADELADLAALL